MKKERTFSGLTFLRLLDHGLKRLQHCIWSGFNSITITHYIIIYRAGDGCVDGAIMIIMGTLRKSCVGIKTATRGELSN